MTPEPLPSPAFMAEYIIPLNKREGATYLTKESLSCPACIIEKIHIKNL